MPRCIAYLRCSTTAQTADDRYGFKRQDAVASRSEARHGLSRVATVTDTISGGIRNREGLDSLPAVAAQHNASAISLSEVDRLSRDLMDGYVILDILLKTGLDIYSDDLDSRVNMRDERSVREVNDRLKTAYDERARMRRRTYGALLSKAAEGKPVRPINAYGFHNSQIFEPQAQWIRWMFERAMTRGAQKIAEELTEKAVTPPSGSGAWRKGTVLQILSNPLYSGTYLFGREGTCQNPTTCGERRLGSLSEQISGVMVCQRCGEAMRLNTQRVSVPQIVTPETMEAARQAKQRRKTNHSRTGKRRDIFGLQGRIYCADCGGAMGCQIQSYESQSRKNSGGETFRERSKRHREWLREYLTNGRNGTAAARACSLKAPRAAGSYEKRKYQEIIERFDTENMTVEEAVRLIPLYQPRDRYYYFCHRAMEGNCQHGGLHRITDLHEAVLSGLREIFEDETALEAALAKPEIPVIDRSADISALQDKIKRVNEGYDAGIYDAQETLQRKRDYQKQLDSIPRPKPQLRKPDIKGYRQAVMTALDSASLADIMEAANAVVRVSGDDSVVIELAV